jgi:hypothetical protein
MVQDEGAKTLIGRKETHGRKYPNYLEKISLIFGLIAAVYIGQWMWLQSDWSSLALWSATLCGLPLVTMLIGELIARIVRKIHLIGDD